MFLTWPQILSWFAEQLFLREGAVHHGIDIILHISASGFLLLVCGSGPQLCWERGMSPVQSKDSL